MRAASGRGSGVFEGWIERQPLHLSVSESRFDLHDRFLIAFLTERGDEHHRGVLDGVGIECHAALGAEEQEERAVKLAVAQQPDAGDFERRHSWSWRRRR